MKRLSMAFLVFCAGLFIFAGKTYCEGLTAQEEKIYYDYWETYTQSFDSDEAEKITAEKYGISTEEMQSIEDKGIHRPITEQEKSILEEQTSLLKAGGEINKVINGLCQKYGLSEAMIQELMRRKTVQAVEGMWNRTHDSQ